MKILITVFLILTSAWAMGFSLENPKKRIVTGLHVYEYNSVARRFMDRPTVVYVQKIGKEQTLFVEYEPYDATQSDNYVSFSEKKVDEYLSHISKYQQWAKQAIEAGDVFEKDIGKSDSSAAFKTKFTFSSGNATTHYLLMTTCIVFTCAKNSVALNLENSSALVDLLKQLQAGSLVTVESVSEKYK